MLIFTFLIVTILKIYIKLFLLLFWMNIAKCNLNNLVFQYITKYTGYLLKYIYLVFSKKFKNIIILIISYIFSIFIIKINFLFNEQFISFNKILIISFLSVLKTGGFLIFWLISIRPIIKWISFKYNNLINHVVFQLTDPLVNLIQKKIPIKNTIEIVEIIIIFVLYIINLFFLKIIPLWSHI